MKVAICGKIRSGKDTLGDFFKHKGFEEYKLSGPITDIIHKLFPYEMSKGKPVEHYRHIGQSMRELDEDVWVNRLLSEMDMWAQGGNVVVTDVRQSNEVARLRAEGFTIIKVVASELRRIARMKKAGDRYKIEDIVNDVENGVDWLVADYTIVNEGTKKDLYLQFLDLYEELEQKERGGK